MHTHNHSPVTPHAPAPTIPSTTPAPESTIKFADLALVEPLHRALAEKNYTIPSPIQAKSIPFLLQGRDLIGVAQTGTGKTAAFALPILQRLAAHPTPATPKRPRVLVLAPTRELAAQIQQSFSTYGKYLKLSSAVVFGGVSASPQIRTLARGVDILIATPGPVAGPRALQARHPRQSGSLRPRRSRPHARPRLRARDQAHHHQAPAQAPVAPLLRHHAARHPGTRLVDRA